VCFGTLAVPKQNDFRAVRLEAEVFDVLCQHRAVAFAALTFIYDEMLEQRVRLASMNGIGAQGDKYRPANSVVCFKNKEEVLRIGMYLLNPVLSQIHFNLRSNRPNQLTIEIRDGGDVLVPGLGGSGSYAGGEYAMLNTKHENRGASICNHLDRGKL
jgi:hypothetical protein